MGKQCSITRRKFSLVSLRSRPETLTYLLHQEHRFSLYIYKLQSLYLLVFSTNVARRCSRKHHVWTLADIPPNEAFPMLFLRVPEGFDKDTSLHENLWLFLYNISSGHIDRDYFYSLRSFSSFSSHCINPFRCRFIPFLLQKLGFSNISRSIPRSLSTLSFSSFSYVVSRSRFSHFHFVSLSISFSFPVSISLSISQTRAKTREPHTLF